MKKLFFIIFILIAALVLIGCDAGAPSKDGASASEQAATEPASTTAETTESSEIVLPRI